jgi:hypothetical protein
MVSFTHSVSERNPEFSSASLSGGFSAMRQLHTIVVPNSKMESPPMSPPNYALEGRIREKCADAGVLETALEDFIMDFRAYRFTSEAELPKWIEQCRIEKPQRFALVGSEEQQLAIDAFGPHPNYTKRAQLVRQVGEARAAEIAATFGTTLGGKGGKVPAHIKVETPDASTNPWAAIPENLDDRGRYNQKAFSKQASLTRAVGEAKAAAVAAAVGAKLGDIRPPRRAA